MLFYIFSIVGADLLIILFNIWFNKFELSLLYIILAAVLGAIAVIAIDGVFAFIIRRLPEKWFSYDKKIWNVSKAECNFYEKLGIKLWKDKILELGVFTSFSKKTIANPDSKEYMERFILESNYGAIIHIANAIFGFLVIFCFPLKLVFCFGLPISIVNAILSLLPYMILRYNIPRLHRMRNLLEKKELRQQK
ncbi:MAG: hypothetical protein IIU99_00285 [Treponema sp.]|jgi:hypothetical protein|nr:hypothetical protein [Treponema sp.]MBQ5646350.1 hypothetical protein [Treponema sp.]MBQ5877433.1 hypothetical protein [Treponema sp.]